MTIPESGARPIFSFDVDGVLCRPPLGLNLAIAGRFGIPPLPEPVAHEAQARSRGRRALAAALEALRFAWRTPMPDAAAGLAAVSAVVTPVIVTGRSDVGRGLMERWLERHGLKAYFTDIHMSIGALRGPQFKLATLRRRDIFQHIDDDGATVRYLAADGRARIYLRDWPLNRGEYPANVTVVRSLGDLAETLARRGVGFAAPQVDVVLPAP